MMQARMRRYRKEILVSLVAVIGLVLGLSLLSIFIDDSTNGSPSQTNAQLSPAVVSPASVPITGSPTPETENLRWVSGYDGMFEYAFAYPSMWVYRPATASSGESAWYSFDVASTPNTGGVPNSEIKVAVVYFPPDSDRTFEFNQSQIQSQQQVTVDGFEATRREMQGQAGSSITTEVPVNAGTYLISAYPADSQLMQAYDEFLSRIDLDAESPLSITSLDPGESVTSPLVVEGEAPGNWFFEGQLPLTLQTYDGQVIATASATTTESWMTTERIPFSATISFTNPDDNFGSLTIMKSNPSGLPENKQSFYLPVQFNH